MHTDGPKAQTTKETAEKDVKSCLSLRQISQDCSVILVRCDIISKLLSCFVAKLLSAVLRIAYSNRLASMSSVLVIGLKLSKPVCI